MGSVLFYGMIMNQDHHHRFLGSPNEHRIEMSTFSAIADCSEYKSLYPETKLTTVKDITISIKLLHDTLIIIMDVWIPRNKSLVHTSN